jgi:two-component system, NarL family, nitrate/nitrite response regulator NarL
MLHFSAKKTVGVCETQPVTALGLRAVLQESGDLVFLRSVDHLAATTALVRDHSPHVVVVDKAVGVDPLLGWLSAARELSSRTACVVWGVSLNEAEALRLVQAGARGIIRKSAAPENLLECIRAAASGITWMEDSLFRQAAPQIGNPFQRYSSLTTREHQVMELVEQGLRNKDIAQELGIRPGTVKIHLKHIFEKTGVRGRYGLALTGLREKGLVSVAV